MSGRNAVEYYTGTGVNAADVLFTTATIEKHYCFTLMSTAGTVDLVATLDGVNFSTVVLALEDQGATANGTYAVVTVAGRMYKIIGKYRQLRVRQVGATASAATLMCGSPGTSP